MLAEDLDARDHILWIQGKNRAGLISNDRRIGHSTFNRIAARRRFVRLHEQGNLGAAPQHLLDHALMRLASVFAERIETEYVAQALDHCRFACTPALPPGR